MVIQDTDEIQMLQRLLEKAKRNLEEARKQQASWANKLQDGLKAVESLEFLLKIHGKPSEPQEGKRAEILLGFGRKSIKHLALEVLKVASHPMGVSEICEKLKVNGREVDVHTVSTILSQQAKKGVFKKIRKGVFSLPDGSGEKE